MKQLDVLASAQIIMYNPILKENAEIKIQYFTYLRKLLHLVKWDKRKYTKAQINFYKKILCGENLSPRFSQKVNFPVSLCYLIPYDFSLMVAYHKKVIYTEKITIVINKIVTDFNLPVWAKDFLYREFDAALGDNDAWHTVMEPTEDEMYIFPESDKRYLSEEEVREISSGKLRFARNEIFARHGRIFKDPELSDYFEQQPWYVGTILPEQFDNSVFNKYEKKNLKLIQKIEDEKDSGSEEQKMINDAYAFLKGKVFNKRGYETTLYFLKDGIITEYADVYETNTPYSITVKYEFNHGYYQNLLFMNIDGEEYYFEGYDDIIRLIGNGVYDGWYDQIEY